MTVLAKGAKGRFKKVATHRLGSADGNFAVSVNAKPGTWRYKVTYADRRQVVGATSRTVKVTVRAKPSSSVKLGAVKVSNGRVTVAATVSPKAPRSGAKVELLVLKTTGGAPRFVTVGSASVKGRAKVTLHGKLARENTLGAGARLRAEGPALELLGVEDGRGQVGPTSAIGLARAR